ncbi:MAG: 4Fe-4S dicluster domain-containing protein [Planctomycetes bacterium]|nr:4Fe-4S dicluster domain-containing protein [Planctomycetota bacterium]
MGKTKAKAAGKMIVCRIARCLGCRSCEIACAVVHSQSRDLLAALAESPRPQARVRVEPVGEHGLPIQCRHCESAPCITVCPTEAMHRASEQSPVVIDAERCIGCKLCMVVCPFGVIEASADGKAVVKCDLCAERTQAGELPACVAACLTRALQFVDAGEDNRRKRREAAKAAAQGAAEADAAK